jgi:hypothetical protein
VIFFIDGIAQPSASLSGGVATLSTSALPQGQHSVYAAYSGDSNYASGTSAQLIQIVNSNSQAATSTALSPSFDRKSPGQPDNTLYLRQSLTLNAHVTSGVAGAPTGSVAFRDGEELVGTAKLDGSGNAILPVHLRFGSHSIVAIYGGDSNFGASFSDAVIIQRSPRPH